MADTKYSIWYEADYEIPLYVTEYKKLEMYRDEEQIHLEIIRSL